MKLGLVVCFLLLLCVLPCCSHKALKANYEALEKKNKALEKEYQATFEKSVQDWYHEELQKLRDRDKAKTIQSAMQLPKYDGIDSLKVLTLESVVLQRDLFYDSLVALEQRRIKKLKDYNLKDTGNPATNKNSN